MANNHLEELKRLQAETEEFKRRAAVVEAFLNGQAVEFKARNYTADWQPCPGPVWSWHTDDYRIAPEKKLRPYRRGEIGLLAQVRCKTDDNIFCITGCLHSGVIVGDRFCMYADLLHLYTFADGSPCGVVE